MMCLKAAWRLDPWVEEMLEFGGLLSESVHLLWTVQSMGRKVLKRHTTVAERAPILITVGKHHRVIDHRLFEPMR